MNPDGNLRTYLETARISNLVSFISQLCKVHAAAVQRAESMDGGAVGGPLTIIGIIRQYSVL